MRTPNRPSGESKEPHGVPPTQPFAMLTRLPAQRLHQKTRVAKSMQAAGCPFRSTENQGVKNGEKRIGKRHQSAMAPVRACPSCDQRQGDTADEDTEGDPIGVRSIVCATRRRHLSGRPSRRAKVFSRAMRLPLVARKCLAETREAPVTVWGQFAKVGDSVCREVGSRRHILTPGSSRRSGTHELKLQQFRLMFEAQPSLRSRAVPD